MLTMKRLLTDKSLKKSPSTAIHLAKTFYDSCLNIDRLNELKAAPLHKIITEIGGWNISENSTGRIWNEKGFNFEETLKKVHLKFRTSVFFSFDVDTDDKNSSRNIIKIDQAGLGIERSYYLANRTDQNLVAYHNYMTTVGVLLGGERKHVEKQMMDVLIFEKELAKIFVAPDNRSQIDQVYRKMSIKDLSSISTKVPWLDFFSTAFTGIAAITESENVVVMAKDYLSKLAAVIKKANKTVLNNYMVWQVVSSKVSMLSAEFREAHEKLDKVLDGTSTVEERWKTCIADTDETVGMALGNLFVNDKFQGSSKEKATEMIDAIRAAFKKRLPLLDWMDDTTRKAAVAKADAIVDMIGFPDFIKDFKKLDEKYQGLDFSVTAEYATVICYCKESKKPEERSYKRQVVDDSTNCECLLQSIQKSNRYCNYGSIGGAVGHELVHAFDNSGRMYDKQGNYGVQWWTNKSIEGFQKKADCLIEQYSKFNYNGEHVNGKYTLGENIADNGGLKAAYSAYQNWVRENGPEKTLPVLKKTNDQLFFIAYGQSWCASIRPEKAKIMLDVDPHSPNKFRVLGTLSNLKEFSDAFKCPVGSKMNPKDKCVIW
ncbi:hypothetical protein QZH41_013745 [Actinostola sp. cb2023]|nr:hypothetical protein QZH41_013745 [Actinostola sp. cb2023]